ncbi:thiosulfate oxidation carrier complex protein SoxZ [Sulfurovum riftiae]|uniref:Thiosulfate oxidation carrier complex protein SoxZ n=1 Tax=Sulfurovum riftiae TaxID=1630136 RepID=A0A151CHW8_9BACT|nr:thiosulfate oxidation carrier complex protein SoxZ [Sulfurovum riftiae]KYJ87128.1 thiosulfate oxidation carrier complex protein SoxZ [Sulfurovum riftiae]
MGKMKIKAKEKNGVVQVKAMFKSLMADKEEAEKKKIDVQYIKRIVGKANGKIVFEADTSGFMSENPLIKFSFTGAKKGDELEFEITDNNGKTVTGKKKIK